MRQARPTVRARGGILPWARGVRARAVVAAVTGLLLVGLAAGTTGASAAELPVAAPALGVQVVDGVSAPLGDVHDGLVPTAPDHACGGLLALLDADGALLGCTHGHDAPRAAAPSRETTAHAPAAEVPCDGDGRSGMRVHVIFARPAGSPDRFPLIEGRLRDSLAVMTHGLQTSAQAAGAGRHVRFLTDAGCRVVIDRVTVSASAARSFAGVSDELRAQGYTDARRRHLLFMDHVDYCGLGTLPYDRDPGIGNAANGRAGSWGLALVGAVCFDTVHAGAHTAMHELLHTLGAVPEHAPNSTGHGHCSDGSDVLCYDDGSGTPMRGVCPAATPFRVDCGNDDYFHPAPPSGHRLTQTWNVADSSFLAGSVYADWTDPTAPAVNAQPHEGGVVLSWPAPGSRYLRDLRVIRDGKTIATLPSGARRYDDTKATAGKAHSYVLEVVDELGYAARSAPTSATRPRTPLLPDLGAVLEPSVPAPPDGRQPDAPQPPDTGDQPDGATDPTRPSHATSSRRSGPDRFATAAHIARSTFRRGVARVYVATGADFPDALSSGAAAAISGGPVLLTARGALPQATADELRRLDAGEVVVVGGPGAVSEEVMARISAAAGAPTRRLSGFDRFATAGAVAVDVATPGGTVYLATGAGFADALAGVPAAAQDRAALLLVTRDAVPAATATALDALSPRRVVVLGGPGAVGESVLDRVRQLTGADVMRVAGSDRFATAAAVAARAFPHGSRVGHIATGAGFADALAGGPAAAAHGGPLLLVMRDALPQATAHALERLSPGEIVVLGGERAVSAPTEAATTTAASRG